VASVEPDQAAEARRLRADARRNRERILEHAVAAFAERGYDAQMDDIAERAGVGVGTVYRHFPTKDALLAELVRRKLAIFTENARVALDADDPWEGFASLLRRNAEAMAADAGFRDALLAVPAAWEAPAEAHAELDELATAVIHRAQEAGVLRSDVELRDMPTIMCGVASVMSMPAGKGSGWQRFLEVVLEGLRV
jgi:AcrR family transcriptional regulator